MSDYIPNELLRDIFIHLPAEPLFRFRFACKAWRDIIDEPMFTKSHFYRHKGSNDQLFIRHKSGKQLYSVSLALLEKHGEIVDQVTNIKNLVGPGVPKLRKLPLPSCNGIILLAHGENRTRLWTIWNPFTRESLRLPSHKHLLTDILGLSYRTCIGIGYDSIADDYKVARISRITVSVGRSYRLETLIYSLKSNSWKRLAGFPTGEECLFGQGVFYNGALHWVTRKYLISLDLNAEIYRLTPLPDYANQIPCFTFYLVELGKYLTVACYRSSPIQGKWMVDIWMLKHNTWTKFFSNNQIANKWASLMPVAYLKGTEQVVFRYNYRNKLVCYDIKENILAKEVEMDGLVGGFSFQVLPENLFRLNTNGDDGSSRKGTLKRKRKRKRQSINYRLDVELTTESTP